VRDWPPKRTQKRQFWPKKKHEALRFYATMAAISLNGLTGPLHTPPGERVRRWGAISPLNQCRCVFVSLFIFVQQTAKGKGQRTSKGQRKCQLFCLGLDPQTFVEKTARRTCCLSAV
jgi:hypothetical protein